MAFVNDAYSYFIKQGWQPHQAAALAAQAQWESGGDPTKSHDKGTGYGIFGWRNPPELKGGGRWADLNQWAKDNKLDPSQLQTQLQFANYELTEGKEKAAGDALKGSTDVTGATNAVMGYLRPLNYDPKNPAAGHGYQGRLAGAQALFDKPPAVDTAVAGATPPSGLLQADKDKPKAFDFAGLLGGGMKQMAAADPALSGQGGPPPMPQLPAHRPDMGTIGLLNPMGGQPGPGGMPQMGGPPSLLTQASTNPYRSSDPRLRQLLGLLSGGV